MGDPGCRVWSFMSFRINRSDRIVLLLKPFLIFNTIINGQNLSVLFRWTWAIFQFRLFGQHSLLCRRLRHNGHRFRFFLFFSSRSAIWAFSFAFSALRIFSSDNSLLLKIKFAYTTGSATWIATLTEYFNMTRATTFITQYGPEHTVQVGPLHLVKVNPALCLKMTNVSHRKQLRIVPVGLCWATNLTKLSNNTEDSCRNSSVLLFIGELVYDARTGTFHGDASICLCKGNVEFGTELLETDSLKKITKGPLLLSVNTGNV